MLHIKDERAAVQMVIERGAILLQQPQQQGAAQYPQIAGDNLVVEARAPTGVPQVGSNGLSGGGGHGGTHVVGVLNTLVHDFTWGDVGDPGTGALPGQHNCPGAGHRPLGSGGALAAVLQGCAVLPLGGAEMRGHHHRCPLPEAAVQRHGGQSQPFPHGGAGPIQAEEGEVLFPGGVGGADALVEEVAGKQPVQIGGR